MQKSTKIIVLWHAECTRAGIRTEASFEHKSQPIWNPENNSSLTLVKILMITDCLCNRKRTILYWCIVESQYILLLLFYEKKGSLNQGLPWSLWGMQDCHQIKHASFEQSRGHNWNNKSEILCLMPYSRSGWHLTWLCCRNNLWPYQLSRCQATNTSLCIHVFISSSATISTFQQFVNCSTKENKKLDLFYANVRNAYRSSACPPTGILDHNLVLLTSNCTHIVQQQPVTIQT